MLLYRYETWLVTNEVKGKLLKEVSQKADQKRCRSGNTKENKENLNTETESQ
jgi:hypothetical protein